MFTGITEEVGTIRQVSRTSRSATLFIACRTVLEGTREGDSIAVNGACLTVIRLWKDAFAADATPETMARTAFSMLRPGSPVNLERALRVGDRLGGHMVSGHIDGTGKLEAVTRDENAVNLRISFIPEKMRYILEKGSVAVDGISLTVTERDDRGFSVSIIPHTGMKTALLDKHPGDPVNIECDMLGKYVEQLMKKPDAQGLTMDALRSYHVTGGHYGI